MDLHPVAVTLARVTYLLALGKDRLTDPTRGNVQIPVYLGDSIQWREQNVDLWSAGNLVIHTDDRPELFESDLSFPDALLDNTTLFDQLVNELADRASRRTPGSPVPSLRTVFTRLSIPEQYQSTIAATFTTMCRLHDQGRDHIWGYYIRNLARPLWLSKSGNQVDMIIGNPPWLAYSRMTEDMQETFRVMSERRGLWAGAELSPHQDLSALFVVRACELYLRKGGHFALVLPNAAIDRAHYAGFRTGSYHDELGTLLLAFSPSWDLRRLRPHFFPRASSVVFGSRVEDAPRDRAGESIEPRPHPLPEEVQIWTGRLEGTNLPWNAVVGYIRRSEGRVRQAGQLTKSPYADSFTQGATLLPLLAFMVTERQSSPLGLARGRIAVQSRRTANEKRPWKDLPALVGVVEKQFVRPTFSGESVYPFRIGEPMLAIVPAIETHLLTEDGMEMYPGMHEWWTQASHIWEEHRSSERLSLMEQADFQSKLTKQLPVAPMRVVYNKSGMHICAAILRDRKAIVTHGLYWAPVLSQEEAWFLSAILNAPITTELTRPLMSYGKDERDIHKHVWELPIPLFDVDDPIHRRIVELAAALEATAHDFRINEAVHFAAIRRHIRDFLMGTPQGQELNDLVADMLE